MMKLTKDDIKFLQELAHELKTQDTAATAEPIFYQIYEREKVWGVGEGCEDGVGYFIGEPWDTEPVYSLEEIKEDLIVDWEFEKEDLKDIKNIEDAKNFCEKRDIDFNLTRYKEIDKFTNAFLTQKAYERHVKANYYHYKSPRPYVQHAWRNPELKRLLEIVKKFDKGEDQ